MRKLLFLITILILLISPTVRAEETELPTPKPLAHPEPSRTIPELRLQASIQPLQPQEQTELEVITTQPIQTATQAVNRSGYYPGNEYVPCNCTWYSKSQRPDLPNDLGNGGEWYFNAQARGYDVGLTPRVGAVADAVGYMHVSIVRAVHGDTITVEEMNYNGPCIINTRVTPVSEWRYIY